MKKIFILSMPTIMTYGSLLVGSILSVSDTIFGVIVMCTYMLTVLFIKWINNTVENVKELFLVPISFVMPGLVIIVSIFLQWNFIGRLWIWGSVAIVFYSIPFFVITFIYAVIKNISAKRRGYFNN